MFNKYLLVIILILFSFLHSFADKNDDVSKKSSLGKYEGYSSMTYKGFDYSSKYLVMRDSLKIAVDIFLPKKLAGETRVPTVIYLTRYIRTLEAKKFIKWLQDPVFGQISKEEIKFFTSHGYACVIVDVRGTGASFGTRNMEFSPEEVKDGAEVVDWIITQPWSNGSVGSTGISYLGTTAEMLLVNRHPAVKACIPRSSIFDLYNHIAWPGGILHSKFIEVWRNTTNALDNNDLGYISKQARRLVAGAHPVDGDKKRKLLKEAQKEHETNFDIFANMFNVKYRDEMDSVSGRTVDEFSVHHYKDKIEKSGTPIYRIGGWYDGALAKSAICGYLSTSNSKKLLIGPWDHGPHDQVSPFKESSEVELDIYSEMLRFFDFHLKGIENGIMSEPPIYYYNMGKEEWIPLQNWPPAGTKYSNFYFSADQNLIENDEKRKSGKLKYDIDFSTGTGGGAGWNSLTTKYRYEEVTGYPDRKEAGKKMLSFSTQAFEEDRELTGFPVVNFYMSANAKDASVFVYLEDKGPDGSVTYVTEGQFRAIHRNVSNDQRNYKCFGPYHTHNLGDASPLVPGEVFELSFDLIPVSYLMQKGHSLRVSIAGVDVDHFSYSEYACTAFEIYCSETYPTSITVPFVE